MSKALKRSIKCNQIDMSMLQLEVDTNSGTPVVSGFDDNAISSVVDNGVGDFTLILKKPFSPTNSDKPKAMVTCLEADRAAHMYASDYDRISIRITDFAAAAQEGAVSVMIVGTNHRFSY